MSATRERDRGRPTPSDSDTVQRVLSVVAHILEQDGPGELRLAEVSRRSSASIGSIYHHFGSREGLVNAGWQWLYEQSAESVAQEQVVEILAASSPEALITLLAEVIIDGDLGRALSKRRRLEVLGAAASSVELRDLIERRRAAALEHVARIGDELRQRQWLPADVTPRAFAILVEALSLGTAVTELSQGSALMDEWRVVVTRTIHTVVVASEDGDRALSNA